MSGEPFSALPLPGPLLEALSSLGYTCMLPVQAEALPLVLAGRDVIVQAPTGSGKTVAFGLGMLAPLTAPLRVQALTLCPTRELAEQVSAELRRLARRTPNVKILSLCGGVPFAPQRASLKQGAHVVVGTPGRVEEHLRKGSLTLDALGVLVLDEADRMLDMGFAPQLELIVRRAPAARQTLLFSATYPESIAHLSRTLQRDPARVDVAERSYEDSRREDATGEGTRGDPTDGAAPDPVQQRFFRVAATRRVPALLDWLGGQRPQSTLVFCNTRVECDQVAVELHASGWVASSIHGELSQRERQHALRLFSNGSCSVLAATDIAARGWHVANLSAVVNLGLPRDPTVYLHRSGRTGRLGQPGQVASFVSDEDVHALRALERAEGHPIVFDELAPRRSLPPPPPRMATLLLNAGKNKKLRVGDVLGAVTAAGIDGALVGEIYIEETTTYVAVAASSVDQALEALRNGSVKGRRVRARPANLRLEVPRSEPSR